MNHQTVSSMESRNRVRAGSGLSHLSRGSTDGLEIVVMCARVGPPRVPSPSSLRWWDRSRYRCR
jgi:hypothetical protein